MAEERKATTYDGRMAGKRVAEYMFGRMMAYLILKDNHPEDMINGKSIAQHCAEKACMCGKVFAAEVERMWLADPVPQTLGALDQ